MSQPTPYTPTTDFSQQEANNASGRSTVNTAALDAEFANIDTTLDQVCSNLELIQRDDGRLGDVIVEVRCLSQDVLTVMGGFNITGLWLPATDYEVNDICSKGEYTYVCKTAHTSGGAFDSAYWIQFGFTAGADAAQAAAEAQVNADSALASQIAAAASQSSASASASSASASALSASNSASTATTQAGLASSSAVSAANSAAAAAAAASSVVTETSTNTLSNKTLSSPVVNTLINFSGASGKIQVGGVDKVTIGSTGITSGIAPASVTPTELSQKLTSMDLQAASGASVNFTSIPSWAKRITVSFTGLSTNSSGPIGIQLGDAGGLETSGYSGAAFSATATYTNYSTSAIISGATAAASVFQGAVVITLLDSATNTWCFSGVIGQSNAASGCYTAGSKSLSATLDRVSVLANSGTFDAGTINILYE